MNRNRYRRALALLLIATLSTGVFFQPRRAHALIGGILSLFGVAAANPVMIAGGAALAIGMVGTLISVNTTGRSQSGGDTTLTTVLGYLGLIGGVILLDNQGAPVLQYAPLTPEQAARLNVSAAERDSFNHEIDEINAVTQTVGAELVASGDQTMERSKALWTSYKDALSPDTLNALGKVSKSFVDSVNAAASR